MSIRSVVVALALVALAAPAFAADRKVPSPTYPTIAAATAAALPGDRILVGPGAYAENVVTATANLQFIGKNAFWDGTLTNGTAGVCLTATGGKTVVAGFTFRSGAATTAQVQLTGDDCKVIKCASRGPSTRFLTINGNRALFDSCTLFAVNSTAVVITGDDAVVQKIKTRQCDDNVIDVEGNRATVTKCAFVLNEDSSSILVNGNDAKVTLNQFTDCDEGLEVDGDGALVEKNKWSHCAGLFVTGDNLTIRKNTITSAPNDQDGIVATSRTAAGGGVIEDNKVTDTAEFGMDLACNNATIQRNRVSGCGTESNESGCRISGDGNTVSDMAVAGGGTHGFDVSGANNTLTNCTSIDSAADGFHVSGDGNKLTACKASLNSGEGLDNEGAGFSATGCTFKDNRIDVANGGTITNAATFATDNKFKTGGTTTAQQVD
jgi:hypothetical protein